MSKRATKRVPKEIVQTNPFVEGVEKRCAVGQPPIVSVKWLDAAIKIGGQQTTQSGWNETYVSGRVMHSVGFMLKSDNNWLTVAMERDAEGDSSFREVQDIPTYAIVKFEVLKEKVTG